MSSKTSWLIRVALVVAVITVIAIGVQVLAPASRAVGASYYVDCSAATNGNGSQSSPWNNLATVNATTFAPGDQILFKRGITCVGTLSPQGSGSSGSPIAVDAYGTGSKPHVPFTSIVIP